MNLKTPLALLLAGATLASCSKDDNDNSSPAPTPTPSSTSGYVVAVTPTAATGVADYLVTPSSLETGTTTIIGNGTEQDGTYRYYVTTNNKFFSMLYGQGNPGAVTAYNIQNSKLTKLTNFQTETVQAFAPVNKDLLLFKISRSLTSPSSSWYKVDTDKLLITDNGTVNTLNMTHNGELAHFTWIKQVGTKVFAPYFTISGNYFNTAYPDSTWIAVFNYADMKLEKIIRDNRTSSIGKYFTDGLSVQENGDIYAYSPATRTSGAPAAAGTLSTTKPSAIVRIKSGTTEFDKSYFLDFENASGGMNITNWYYLGNNNYLVRATTKAEKGAYTSGSNVGILNVADKTYKPVTGLPAKADITSISDNNLTLKDGKTAYIGVNQKDGNNYIYKIDASTLTATRGLKVEGGVIAAVQYVSGQ